MKGGGSYIPPTYVPLGQSDPEEEITSPGNVNTVAERSTNSGPSPWSSGICACCDDMQSCCIGLICPCVIFGKNAEVLGSGTFLGSCTTHFILWALLNTFCCLLTDGSPLAIPGCFLACYACGYRKELRSKYNLQEAPCGDFATHFFCHLCATCQEYREIHERSNESNTSNSNLSQVNPPQVQTMQSHVPDTI